LSSARTFASVTVTTGSTTAAATTITTDHTSSQAASPLTPVTPLSPRIAAIVSPRGRARSGTAIGIGENKSLQGTYAEQLTRRAAVVTHLQFKLRELKRTLETTQNELDAAEGEMHCIS
jgi:hypothetical protein